MPKNGLFAACFPGQGSYEAGIINRLIEAEPDTKNVFEQVSNVGNRLLGVNLLSLVDDEDTTLDDLLDTSPDLAQLAIYALSVATNEAMHQKGYHPEILVGLSFGEIAAMTCGGALTIEQGAEVVCARVTALKASDITPGAMTAILANRQIAEALCHLSADDATVIAGQNLENQTIISGPIPSIQKVEELAQIAGHRAVRLRSPHAFHSPLLSSASTKFMDALKGIDFKPLSTKVLSPILNRFYTTDDDLRSALVEHLTQPFDFPSALDTVAHAGIPTLVEFGGKEGLTKISNQHFTESHITAIPSLPARPDNSAPLQAAINRIKPASNGELPMEPTQKTFDEFWNTRSESILETVRSEFEKFISGKNQEDPVTKPGLNGSIPEIDMMPKSGTLDVIIDTNSDSQFDRNNVFGQLVSLYSEALEYPEEVFSEDVELEGDLGVDSVKQTELLARVGEKFELPPLPTDFRLGEYGTLGRVTDLIAESTNSASMEPDNSPDIAEDTKPDIGRDEVFNQLVSLYSEALEYPEEVFSEDVELEGDLGVDSVKQTELLARVGEKFELPPLPTDFRLGEYGTLGRVTDLVVA